MPLQWGFTITVPPICVALNVNVTNVLRLAASASTMTPVDSGQTPVNGFMPQHTHIPTHTHTHSLTNTHKWHRQLVCISRIF